MEVRVRKARVKVTLADGVTYRQERYNDAPILRHVPGNGMSFMPCHTDGSVVELLVTVGLDMARRRYNSKAR